MNNKKGDMNLEKKITFIQRSQTITCGLLIACTLTLLTACDNSKSTSESPKETVVGTYETREIILMNDQMNEEGLVVVNSPAYGSIDELLDTKHLLNNEVTPEQISHEELNVLLSTSTEEEETQTACDHYLALVDGDLSALQNESVIAQIKQGGEVLRRTLASEEVDKEALQVKCQSGLTLLKEKLNLSQ